MAFKSRRNSGALYSSLAQKTGSPPQYISSALGPMVQEPNQKPGKKSMPSGYRFGMLIGAILAWLVFSANLGILIWASVAEDGDMYAGNCNEIKRINTGVHLLINILSSLLLGASNYCMQCLCAPTRAEIDKAHSKQRFLEIGIQSIWNFHFIRRSKFVLYCLLSISSFPLHLVYNSVFYSSMTSHTYTVLGVDPSLPDPASEGSLPQKWCSDQFSMDPVRLWKDMTAEPGNIERLNNSQCIDAYTKDLLPKRSNLVLIMQSNDTICHARGSKSNCSETYSHCGYSCSNSILYARPTCEESVVLWPHIPLHGWITADDYWNGMGVPTEREYMVSGLPRLRKHPEYWAVDGVPIKECISQKVEPICLLNFSPPLGTAVVVFNFVKAFCITTVLWLYRDQPLVTIGDAVQSFMLSPDPKTTGLCLTTVTEAQNIWKKNETPPLKAYYRYKLSYAKGTSRNVWKTWNFVFFLCILVVAIVALIGFVVTKETMKESWLNGLGAVPTSDTIHGWPLPSSNIIGVVIVANLPQTDLSLFYFIHNGLWTRMLLAAEWSDFAHERKGLRLSSPDADSSQRSSYFLQVPYRCGVPLMALCTLIHWMFSQSIYFAVIDVYSMFGKLHPEARFVTCGYSPIAIMYSVAVLVIIMAVTFIFARTKKLKPGIPLVGSNSAAISAACHPPRDGADLKNPVQWGEVPTEVELQNLRGSQTGEEHTLDPDGAKAAISSLGVGHCSFSSGPMEEPTVGKLYA